MVLQLVLKAAGMMALKLLTSEALTDLFMLAARALAKSTKTEVDNDLVAILEKHLEGKAAPQAEVEPK